MITEFPDKLLQSGLPSTADPSSPLCCGISDTAKRGEAKRIQKLKTTFPIFHSAAVIEEMQVK